MFAVFWDKTQHRYIIRELRLLSTEERMSIVGYYARMKDAKRFLKKIKKRDDTNVVF